MGREYHLYGPCRMRRGVGASPPPRGCVAAIEKFPMSYRPVGIPGMLPTGTTPVSPIGKQPAPA